MCWIYGVLDFSFGSNSFPITIESLCSVREFIVYILPYFRFVWRFWYGSLNHNQMNGTMWSVIKYFRSESKQFRANATANIIDSLVSAVLRMSFEMYLRHINGCTFTYSCFRFTVSTVINPDELNVKHFSMWLRNYSHLLHLKQSELFLTSQMCWLKTKF